MRLRALLFVCLFVCLTPRAHAQTKYTVPFWTNSQPADQNAIQAKASLMIAGDTLIIQSTSTVPCLIGANSPSDTFISIPHNVNVLAGSLTNSLTLGGQNIWMHANGSPPGTPVTAAVLAAGTSDDLGSPTWITFQGSGNNNQNPINFFIVAPTCTLSASITLGGVTFPASTATQAINIATGNTPYTYARNNTVAPTKKATATGCVTFGEPNIGTQAGGCGTNSPTQPCSSDQDLFIFDDNLGNASVFQFVPGNADGHGTCYCVRIETAGSLGTLHSINVPITPGNSYWFSLTFDEINGSAELALFDPTNNFNQVGPLMTAPLPTGNHLASYDFGNREEGYTLTGSGLTFNNVVVDTSYGVFPNYPKQQAAGQTVMIDNLCKGSKGGCTAGGVPLFKLTGTETAMPLRFAGFTIIDQITDGTSCATACGEINFTNTSAHSTRIDHNTFANISGEPIIIGGDVWGVEDHNNIGFGTTSSNVPMEEISLESYNGVGSNGDNSYAQPDTYGTNIGMYLEDNWYGPNIGICFDANKGARVVFRFNFGCNFIQFHGNDSTGRGRGGRQIEAYGGLFLPTIKFFGNAMNWRSGTGLLWANTFQALGTNTYTAPIGGINFRDRAEFGPWAGKTVPGPNGSNPTLPYGANGCDGNSPYDINQGANSAGLLPTVKFSGTAQSGSGLNTLVISGGTFLANALVGYSARDITGNGGLAFGSIITTNTATSGGLTTITVLDSGGFSPTNTYTSGDSIIILFAYPCMDQVGWGSGALLENDPAGSGGGTQGSAVLVSTLAPGPVNQVLDPMLIWDNFMNNVYTGTTQTIVQLSSSSQRIVAGREYSTSASGAQTTATSPFSGAAGTSGWGTLNLRPPTCVQGSHYFATDAGPVWNTSTTGLGATFGNGAGFLCGASGWPASPTYIPFTHPHPLVGGAGTGPVSISPSAENFNSVAVGVTSPGQTATVTNATASPITVTTINYTGANPLDFATPSTNCAGTIASGGNCMITTTFKPSIAGVETATLNFSFTGASGSPVVVSVFGTGGGPQTGSCVETQTTTPSVGITIGRHVGESESHTTSDTTGAAKPGAVCHAIP